ncbi:MAG: stage III sporulation protein AG [Clostridia bacterium]|nr:stage III sporulation protein AG [Clostridia bacterium]
MGFFERVIEKVKDFMGGKIKKRVVENSVIVIIIGIIIVIAGSTLFDGKKDEEPKPIKNEDSSAQEVSKIIDASDSTEIEKRVEKVLSQINGAGKVTVLVTYASGKELVPATDVKKTGNDTAEKDNGGGTRNINQSDFESRLAYEEEQGGSKKPIIIKEILPEVKGVVVVADGASDPRVKDDLSKAVRVLMDVPSHKIQVFERTK